MSEILGSEWIQQWIGLVEIDKELSHIGKLSRFSLRLVCGEQATTLSFSGGKFKLIGDDELLVGDVVEFCGDRAAFEKLFQVSPEPLFNDFLALEKNQPGFTIPSDRIYLLRHLRVLQRLLAIAPRRA